MEDVKMAKFCQSCGYEIPEGSLYCEKCGSPVEPVAPVAPVQSVPVQNTPVQSVPVQNPQVVYQNVTVTPSKTNGFAIAGFVLSIISIFLCCGGLVTGIPGLVLSILGLRDISKNNEGGKGLAIAGIIISSIMIAFSLFYLLILFVDFLSYL